jgi:hypothetical protein
MVKARNPYMKIRWGSAPLVAIVPPITISGTAKIASSGPADFMAAFWPVVLAMGPDRL